MRPTIRYILLIMTILLLPMGGLAQRALGSTIVFLRLQEPFIVSLGNVGLNLLVVIASIVILLIMRFVMRAGRVEHRGLVFTIIPFLSAVPVLVFLIVKYPLYAMGIDSTIAVATSFVVTVIASVVLRVNYTTLYLGIFIGSLVIDVTASIMAGDIYNLGFYVIGYYGPFDGLVITPVFSVLLASLLTPETPNPSITSIQQCLNEPEAVLEVRTTLLAIIGHAWF